MPKHTRNIEPPPIDRRDGLHTIALAILIAIVLARGLMLESIRAPFDPTPTLDNSPEPHAPQAAVGMLLDFFVMLPAIIVLLHRAIRRDFRLRHHPSFLIAAPLAIWLAASVFWSADKFAALVSASHVVAAFVALWSAVQLVRSWQHFRVITSMTLGLLLVYIGKSAIDKFVDMPALRQVWNENKATILKQHNWTAGSYEATQFEMRILHSQLMGFDASPNTFAAQLVLVMTIAAGFIVQCVKDKRPMTWMIFPGATIAIGLLDVIFTGCRAAAGTIAMTIVLLWSYAIFRERLLRHARILFAAAIILFAAGAAFVVQHGITHNSLFQNSLTFRWDYWVGSFRIFLAHPFRGVGWENFGLYYLGARVPRAAESIRDPHNFLVRFFVELGLPGGILAIAFISRFAWDLTIPDPSDEIASSYSTSLSVEGGLGLRFIGMTVLFAILINIVASVDFTQDGAYVLQELIGRFMYGGCLLIAAIAGSIDKWIDPEIDATPAPWLAGSTAVAVGVLLVHNLIEFSLFETGMIFLVAILAGAALGTHDISADALPPRVSRGARYTLVGVTVLWLAYLVAIVIPVVRAEMYAGEGADGVRFGDSQRLVAAVDDYFEAWKILGFNDDYPAQAGRAMVYSGRFTADAEVAALDRAIAADPMRVPYYVDRAKIRAQSRDTAALDDLATACRLDPNNIDNRLVYARYLVLYNHPAQAVEQFNIAMDMNDRLDKLEPKRLTNEQITGIRSEIVSAQNASASTRPAGN